jgi:cytochrome oxidase Cu insertion factor (SCO1/SenC/PrrC family)
MSERRSFLKSAPAAAIGMAGMAATGEAAALSLPGSRAERLARGATPIPNMTVITHTGRMALFNDDLIQGRVVAISMMSIDNEARYPVTARLARVADLLGDKLGRDIHFISVTRDPVADTPERLREFAARFGSRAGWTFVWPEPASLYAIEDRVYHHKAHLASPEKVSHGAYPPNSAVQRSLDVVFYGNAKVGLWSTFPADITADDAARRLAWVMPGPPLTAEMQRAGPRAIVAGSYAASDNRMA